ncbi:MAG TPA: phytanoyl-CoA dioxygenase family protein [Labilithrix sp.]|nr:phytanoyl-CoA dioxygenase family protein [Labilithrix sp.]
MAASASGIDLESYARDGFVVVPGFVDKATCERMIERARTLVDAFEPRTVSIFTTNEQTRTTDDYFLGSGNDVRFFFEEEAFLPDGSLRQDKSASINKIGHALHDKDPIFREFSTSDKVSSVVSSLAMKLPQLVQSMYIFKNPFIGGDVQCHQDATFLHTQPTSVVGLWFALEDATVENGCLWALPGGHREPLRKRFARKPSGGTVMRVLDESPLPPTQPGAPWVPLEAEAGTMVILHGLLPHWSSANRSPRSRHAYALHFVDDACAWDADNWLDRSPLATP